MHFKSALMPSFETAPYIQYQKVQGDWVLVSAFTPVETKHKSSINIISPPLLRKEGLGVVDKLDIEVVVLLITIRQYGIPLIFLFSQQSAECCR